MSNEPMILKPPFVVVCIDDKNKPVEIPQEQWVKFGKRYTVNKVVPTLDGKIGFVIDELGLGPSTFPYESIRPTRFAIPMPSAEEEAVHATDNLLEELNITKEA